MTASTASLHRWFCDACQVWHSEGRGPTLHKALKLAAVRLGILADRLEGCNAIAAEEGREPVHELIDEARMFEEEARAAAGMGKRR